MFKAILQNVTLTPKTNIPMSVALDTNDNVDYNSSTNTIVFNKAGIYDIMFQCTATNFSASATITEYLNGIATTYALSSVTPSGSSVTDALVTFVIPDVLYIKPSQVGNNVTLSYQSNLEGLINSGVVIVEKRR